MFPSYVAGASLLASRPWLLAGPDWAMTIVLNDERWATFHTSPCPDALAWALCS